MSIVVDLADLAETLAGFGTGFLLTTRDGTIKVVSTAPRPLDGLLVVATPGHGSIANVGDQPAVTLLWPPVRVGEPSLLVDGTATVVGDDLHVRPRGAVLHRSVQP